MPGCIVSATTASFRSVAKRRRRATPVITSTFENVSDIGVCLGLSLGPPAIAGVRSKRGALQRLKLPRFRGHRTIWVRGVHMGKTRAAYPPEFRRQMVELVRAGRSPEELAREFEPTAQSIRNWLAQSERNAGRGDGGLTTAEREELNRLRRENRQLRLEREILSKAAAWFARETNTIPRKGSSS